MINLFVLVILREFDEHYYNTDNPLNNYKNDIQFFKIEWNKIADSNYHGKKIN